MFKTMGKFLSVWMSVMMLLTQVPYTALASENSVTVYVTAQTDEYGFTFMDTALTVASDLSENYAGYEDEFNGEQVTALDVIIAAHLAIYGEGNWESEINTGLTKAFGKNGFVTFMVNQLFPGDGEGVMYTMPQTKINDGDTIQYFFPVGSYSEDYMTWFEEGRELTVEVDQSFELTLNGYSIMYSMWGMDYDIYPIQGAYVCTLLTGDSQGYLNGTIDIPFEEPTDADGKVTLSFDTEGEYYLTAADLGEGLETEEDMDFPIILPLVKINVVANEVDYWGGTGTSEDPFTIGTKEGLEALRDSVNDSLNKFKDTYFQLTADITLDDTWEPIGKPGTPDAPFCGIFDGGNYTITFAEGSKALFGVISEDDWTNPSTTAIKNLKIYGEYIADFGLISGFNASTLSNPVTIDNITIKSGTTIKHSGLAGDPGGIRVSNNTVFTLDISNCVVEAGVVIGYDKDTGTPTVHDDYYESGIYGSGPGVGSFVSGLCGKITNSKSSATVYGQNNVGGIAGYKAQSMRDFRIDNCTFDGEIIATGDFVGGIVGGGYVENNSAGNQPGVSVTNSYVSGEITGNNYVGGIFGGEGGQLQAWDNDSTYGAGIKNNIFTGTITATVTDAPKYAGSIIGYMRSINKYNVIEDNYYLSSSSDKGIGGARYIDTSAVETSTNPDIIPRYINTNVALPGVTQGSGWNLTGITKADHNRNDDPLGADAHKLAKAIADTTVTSDTLTGSVVSSGTAITLSSSMSTLPIYYTTDGSEPTLQSILYEEPIQITANTKIKAKTIRGDFQSQISEFDYMVVDSDSPSVAIGNSIGWAGDEVSVTVSLTDNPVFAAFKMRLNFDKDKLTPVSITEGDILSVGTFESNVNELEADLSSLNYVTAYWVNDLNVAATGILFTVRFKIADDAELGEIPLTISYQQGDIVDFENKELQLALIPGSIVVENYTLGDIFMDGCVNPKDGLKLAQYLAGWSNIVMTPTELRAADVYPDGVIDQNDSIHLARYLAEWSSIQLGVK